MHRLLASQRHHRGQAHAVLTSLGRPTLALDLVYFQRTEDQEVMAEIGVQHESWGSFAEGRNGIFKDPTLSAIATEHGKSVAQVILRWLIQRSVVCIPKSVRAERMAENIDVFDFALTERSAPSAC